MNDPPATWLPAFLRRAIERSQGYLLLKMPREAARELDGIAGVAGAVPAYLRARIDVETADGNWTAVLGLASRLRALEPGQPAHYISMAFATRRCGTLREAEAILSEGAKRFPGIGLFWYNLACYAAVGGRPGEALLLLGKALKIEPDLLALAAKDEDFESVRDRIAEWEMAAEPPDDSPGFAE